jgi:hypothetical protein
VVAGENWKLTNGRAVAVNVLSNSNLNFMVGAKLTGVATIGIGRAGGVPATGATTAAGGGTAAATAPAGTTVILLSGHSEFYAEHKSLAHFTSGATHA